ncbi:NAD(P)/FAD-dependent oxidoreductase [Vaginella massiliensis]|uniref:NAD(P)/FAD-dependent oxidoreductase n=1 Tax=Vaginella massiliensis TaxID=1816680 RepID=UPI0008391050|nr:FAD-dependent oxidoreductase [Vaginella massiliensis]
MKEVDYLVVGLGVAATAFVRFLLANNHSFLVINNESHCASKVAAGLYNPVVLKRFSLVWDAPNQLSKMKSLFGFYEQLFQKKYTETLPVYRIFNDEQELNTWDKKSHSHPDLISYLSTDYTQLENYKIIKQPYGSGEVLDTGRINLRELIPDLEKYLSENNLLLQQTFDYNLLQIEEYSIRYQTIQTKRIIFCEGYHIIDNPFFKNLPIIGVKGEVLTVKTKVDLPKAVVKGKEFLFPMHNDEYFIGATYDRDNLNYDTTPEAKDELLNGVQKVIDASFELKSHEASIRPTVKDRRPIVGAHPIYQNMYCINGMGTRGTMLAPSMAEQLYRHIESGEPIDPLASITRYYHLFNNS